MFHLNRVEIQQEGDRNLRDDEEEKKYAADDHKKDKQNDGGTDNNKAKDVSLSDAEGLLKAWGLSDYIGILIDEEGWNEPDYWIDIEFDYLKSIGFKTFHAVRFIKKTNETFKL